MRGLRPVLAAMLGALALAACVPQDAPQPPVRSGQTAELEAGVPRPGTGLSLGVEERAACEEAGGTVQRRGMLGNEMCVRRFADAGRQCTDSAQCQGKCITGAGAMSPEKPVSGACQPDDRLFGCYAEVRNGLAPHAICVD